MDHDGWGRVLADAAGRPDLHEHWIQGLANNPAASASVIRRLITAQDRLAYPRIWLTWIDVSPETFEELAAHPDVDVRRAVAENTHTCIETLAMLAADAEPRVRLIALVTANDRGLTLPASLLFRTQPCTNCSSWPESPRTQPLLQFTRHLLHADQEKWRPKPARANLENLVDPALFARCGGTPTGTSAPPGTGAHSGPGENILRPLTASGRPVTQPSQGGGPMFESSEYHSLLNVGLRRAWHS